MSKGKIYKGIAEQGIYSKGEYERLKIQWQAQSYARRKKQKEFIFDASKYTSLKMKVITFEWRWILLQAIANSSTTTQAKCFIHTKDGAARTL